MKSSKILIILFFTLFAKYYSQSITTDYMCTYNLEYNINGKTDNEQFIMFIDAKEEKSYFLSSINYVKDTIKTGDPMVLASYESDFNEKIVSSKNKFNVFEDVKGVKLSSEESSNLNWEILNKTQKNDNITMQLAKTKAYGRIWYAWFSKDIPIDFGPYKFNGLPGFIVSLFDENNTFTFTLQKFKKKRKTLNLPNQKNYKKIQKADYNKTRYKIQIADDDVVIFDNPKEKLQWQKNVEKRYTNMPKLDIQYPFQ